MSRLYKIVFVTTAAACVGLVQAQTSDTSKGADQSATTSKDPFVQKREEKSQAKRDYKAKKITKDEYKAERKAENDRLKATGQRSDTEKNLDVAVPGGR